ncbi:MAG: hypothetical protein NZL95_07385 [Chitinophagales bacterium]|nr:hypothetical protein [Chitinophagales bacterium]MDW8428359.1 hypothetical protein [Chitinophagales bacterium]
MKIKPLFLYIVSMIGLLACGHRPNQAGNAIQPEEKPVEATTLTLDLKAFSEIPEEIIGCSCAFSVDSSTYEDGRFLYLDDMEKIAYVNINGTLTRLLVTERHSGERNLTVRAANETYRISLEAGQLREYGEVTYLKGILTVTDAHGTAAQLSIFGTCGC